MSSTPVDYVIMMSSNLGIEGGRGTVVKDGSVKSVTEHCSWSRAVYDRLGLGSLDITALELDPAGYVPGLRGKICTKSQQIMCKCGTKTSVHLTLLLRFE